MQSMDSHGSAAAACGCAQLLGATLRAAWATDQSPPPPIEGYRFCHLSQVLRARQ